MDEFLYDYNKELLSYMIGKKIELKTGVNPNDNQDTKEPETIEARSLFSELGF